MNGADYYTGATVLGSNILAKAVYSRALLQNPRRQVQQKNSRKTSSPPCISKCIDRTRSGSFHGTRCRDGGKTSHQGRHRTKGTFFNHRLSRGIGLRQNAGHIGTGIPGCHRIYGTGWKCPDTIGKIERKDFVSIFACRTSPILCVKSEIQWIASKRSTNDPPPGMPRRQCFYKIREMNVGLRFTQHQPTRALKQTQCRELGCKGGLLYHVRVPVGSCLLFFIIHSLYDR